VVSQKDDSKNKQDLTQTYARAAILDKTIARCSAKTFFEFGLDTLVHANRHFQP